MLNFNLDLQKQDNFSKAFTARMGDVGEQFSVTLFDNQTPYLPVNGDVVSFRVVTPSGKFASVAGTMSGNKATFTLNGQITSEAGYYQRAYVAVSNGTKLRTTQDLIFFSLGNSDINKGQADYYVAELDKLLQQLNEEFDEWLAEREQDYSDLLARIVALTNRVTGLETKLDDIIAQLQKNMINTTNVFDSSLILMPESTVGRRVDGQTIDTRGWGSILIPNANVIRMFEPNKTYHTKYVAELLTLTGGTVTQGGQFGLAFYSGKPEYPTVWLTQIVVPNDMQNMKVGDTIVMEKTFTTPSELHNTDANYQILQYSRRDSAGVVDAVRFHDIMIQEGSMFTGVQTNPNNTLTKFDENRLKKSILVDPKMTGLNPPVVENGSDGSPTTSISYNSAGYLDIQNLNPTGRSRVYWSATMLGLDVPDSKQTFNVTLKVRSTRTLEPLEVGYAGLTTNPKLPLKYEWQTLSATIQAGANTALCLYLGANSAINISEMYVFPANTDITSNRVERIEKVTTGTPDTLTGVDANTLFNSGVWTVINGVNMPQATSGTYFYLRVINFNATNCIQFASNRRGVANMDNLNYVRQAVNGSWQEWRLITTLLMDTRVDTTADDFNNLIETGSFVNTSVTNSPTGAASTSWYLEVFRYGTAGNYILQRCTQISNTRPYTYQRQRFNGTWTAWQKITTDLSYLPVEDAGATKDLNNFGTTSEFMIYNPINPPVAGQTWYVEVKGYNSTYCKQTATSTGTADNTYTRQKINNVWTPWRLITKTTV